MAIDNASTRLSPLQDENPTSPRPPRRAALGVLRAVAAERESCEPLAKSTAQLRSITAVPTEQALLPSGPAEVASADTSEGLLGINTEHPQVKVLEPDLEGCTLKISAPVLLKDCPEIDPHGCGTILLLFLLYHHSIMVTIAGPHTSHRPLDSKWCQGYQRPCTACPCTPHGVPAVPAHCDITSTVAVSPCLSCELACTVHASLRHSCMHVHTGLQFRLFA